MKGPEMERVARRTEKSLAADESVGKILWPPPHVTRDAGSELGLASHHGFSWQSWGAANRLSRSSCGLSPRHSRTPFERGEKELLG